MKKINPVPEIEMGSLRSRLRYALERSGLTQRELARKRKVTEQAVSKWIQSERIPYEHQEAVAQLLGVSVGWLTHGEVPRGEQAAVVEVPIVTWESVTGQRREIGKTWTVGVGKNAFGLIVHGDAMNGNAIPTYPEGTVIVVDPDRRPQSGTRVIAQLQDGSIAFRAYLVDAGKVLLRPINQAYETLSGTGAKILGTVVQSIIPEPKG